MRGKDSDWKSWIIFFLESTIRMANNQYEKLDQAEVLFKDGLNKLSRPSSKKVWGSLFSSPITTVVEIKKMTDLSPSTIRKSLKHMEELQMIFGNEYQRNRRYYFYDLLRIFS